MIKILLAGLAVILPLQSVVARDGDAGTILRAYAEDYAHDPTARDIEIGFDVSGERFFMTVDRQEEGPHIITFETGFPDYPIMYWDMELDTLHRIEAGMTGETATQRSRADDARLMTLRLTEGFPRFLFRRNQELSSYLASFKVHFFIRGTPEIVPIGAQHAVTSHGTSIMGLAYAPRMSALIDIIQPGDAVNREEDLNTNPFDTLFVAVSGRTRARIGGNEVVFEEGHVMYIPADVEHVFWNDFDEPFTGVMVLYGPWLNESPPERAYPWW